MKRLSRALLAATAALSVAIPAAPALAAACSDTDGDGYFEVSPSVTSDHGNGAVSGSIQNCLNATGNGVDLAAGATYTTSSEIKIPSNRGLRTPGKYAYNVGGLAKVTATGGWSTGEAVIDASYTIDARLQGVHVNGSHLVTRVVDFAGSDYGIIDAIVAEKTRYDDSVTDYLMAVNVQSSDYPTITNSLIRYAGSNGSATAGNAAQGAGIYGNNVSAATIAWNEIGYTSAAGINLTKGYSTVIDGNYIHNTGQATFYGGNTADGITFYGNGTGHNQLGVEITNNNIQNWGNHGLHVSGRHVKIDGNTVGSPRSNAPGKPMWIGDAALNRDCTYDIVLSNNTVSYANGGYAFVGGDLKAKQSNGNPGAFSVYGNNFSSSPLPAWSHVDYGGC